MPMRGYSNQRLGGVSVLQKLPRECSLVLSTKKLKFTEMKFENDTNNHFDQKNHQSKLCLISACGLY